MQFARIEDKTNRAQIPQLAMHSIRATTGSKDPGLGVKYFTAFLKHYESVESTIKVD